MTADAFRAWMARHNLSLSGAAAALGYTRRQVVNFRNGETAIGPRQEAVINQAALAMSLSRGRKRALDKA